LFYFAFFHFKWSKKDFLVFKFEFDIFILKSLETGAIRLSLFFPSRFISRFFVQLKMV